MGAVKWHVSSDGVPRRCRAKTPDSCRAEGAVHGDSRADAMRAFDDKMIQEGHSVVVSHGNSGEYWRAETQEAPPEHHAPYDPEAKYGVLSDVDGTLTRGSFVLDHAVFLHEQGIIDVGEEKDAWLASPKDENAITRLANAYREGIVGLTAEDLQVDKFVRDYMSDHSKFYSTLQELRIFRNRGWEVQLISGSPSFLISPFAKENGFFGKGSDYVIDKHGRFTGEVEGMFGGDAKRAFVQKLNLSRMKRVIAYGDTTSDAPLLDEADHKVIVAPNEHTRKSLSFDREIVD